MTAERTAEQSSNWCAGCASAPEDKQVNLPAGWTEGQPVPEGLTIHSTANDRRRFAFIGEKHAQNRHYFADGQP